MLKANCRQAGRGGLIGECRSSCSRSASAIAASPACVPKSRSTLASANSSGPRPGDLPMLGQESGLTAPALRCVQYLPIASRSDRRRLIWGRRILRPSNYSKHTQNNPHACPSLLPSISKPPHSSPGYDRTFSVFLKERNRAGACGYRAD